MQQAIELASDLDMDWLISNLDIDEALVITKQAGSMLSGVPSDIDQFVLLNHEVVPESPESCDYFRCCTLAKQNPAVVCIATSEVERCLQFWEARVVAVGAALPQGSTRGGLFCAYANGKSVVRVAACRSKGACPAGSHCWQFLGDATSGSKTSEIVPGIDRVTLDPSEACILHYPNCGGAADFLRKYGARQGEQWNTLPFHRCCQSAQLDGAGALAQLFDNCVLLRDPAEAERQIAAGICIRVRSVQDACKWEEHSRFLETMD